MSAEPRGEAGLPILWFLWNFCWKLNSSTYSAKRASFVFCVWLLSVGFTFRRLRLASALDRLAFEVALIVACSFVFRINAGYVQEFFAVMKP